MITYTLIVQYIRIRVHSVAQVHVIQTAMQTSQNLSKEVFQEQDTVSSSYKYSVMKERDNKIKA